MGYTGCAGRFRVALELELSSIVLDREEPGVGHCGRQTVLSHAATLMLLRVVTFHLKGPTPTSQRTWRPSSLRSSTHAQSKIRLHYLAARRPGRGSR